jgi:two-component system, cell cycle response regulator
MRVLVAEDSTVYRTLITRYLREWGFEAIVATDGTKAWQTLQQPACPTLAMLDWVLPDIDGIELCRRIRQKDPSSHYVYVILLTAKRGRENLLKGMEAGADDYLVKPFDELELKARLLVGKRIVNLQNDLVLARESMRHAATHDALTGLLNRAEVLRLLECELARAKRERKPVAVVMADIDHFKDVNDTHGHLFGDQVLTEVARRLKSNLRIYDGVGRLGGEEFLLILPSCDLTAAMLRANQLRLCVVNNAVAALATTRTVTLSMGVAIAEPGSELKIEALLAKADAGLYEAKRQGRNRVQHVDSRTLVAETGG